MSMNGHHPEPAGWSRLQHHIQAALDRGFSGWEVGDIYHGIVAGELQWWPGEDCAMVTEVVDTPRFRFLGLSLAGGDLGQIEDMIQALKPYAREMGCDRMRYMGRRGWARALRDDWQEISITAEMMLGDS